MSQGDYSQIVELLDIERLHLEQAEKWKMRLAEKEERLGGLRHDLQWRHQQVEQEASDAQGVAAEIARLEALKAQTFQEGQDKITQLNQRLMDLNQRLAG